MTLAELISKLQDIAFERADFGERADEILVVMRDQDHYAHVVDIHSLAFSNNTLVLILEC